MRTTLLRTALLVGSIGAAGAQTTAWTGATSQDWATPANWNNGVPGINSKATINLGTGNTPVITTAVNKSATAGGNDFWLGNGSGTSGRLDINSGGSLNTNGTWVFVGNGGGTGTIHVNSGGTLTSDNDIRFNQGTIQVNPGGSLTAGRIVGNGGTAGQLNVAGNGILTTTGAGTANGSPDLQNLAVTSFTGSVSAARSANFRNGAASDMSGGSITTGGEIRVGNGGVHAFTQSAGSVATGSWMVVGIAAGGNGTYNMSGGSVAVSTINAGSFTTIGAGGGTGELSLTGGTWLDNNKTFLGENAGGTGTLRLGSGAIFTTGRIEVGGGTGNLIFNGGTLRARTAAADFISATAFVDLQAGGAVIDTNGFTVTSTASFSGVGGLTKTGAGTLNLRDDAHGFSGPVIVSGGTLNLGARFVGQGLAGISVADGAGLGIHTVVPDDALAPVDLSFGGTATTLTFDLGNQGYLIPEAPIRVDGGTFAVSGTVTVNLTGDDLASGDYTLIDYSTATKTGSVTWQLGTLPPGATGTLTDTGTALVLDVSIPEPIWDGAVDSNWDTTTQNWIDSASLAPTTFGNGGPATFDDDATSFTVNVAANVTPALISFQNITANYTLGTSGGVIAGSTGLSKTGAGRLTISDALANTFTGVVSLGGGVVSVGSLTNGGAAGPLGAAAAAPANLVFNGGVLEYTGAAGGTDRGFTILGNASGLVNAADLVLGGQVLNGAAGGSFSKSGPGKVTFSHAGTSTFGNGFPSLDVRQGTWAFDGTGGGQVVNVPGEVWVGSTPNVPANLSLLNTTVNITSWLALSRGNGDSNTVVNVDLNGSQLTTGQASSGYDGGLANNESTTHITLTDSTWTNTGTLLQLSESAGSTTHLTLNAGAVLNTGRLLLSLGGDSSTTMVLNGNADVNLGGSWFAVSAGYNGQGASASLTLNDSSTITDTNGDFNIADVGAVTGDMVINDSAVFEHVGVTGVNACYIGKGIGATGTLTLNGGSFLSDAPVRVGWSTGSQGTVDLNAGTFTQSDAADPFVVGYDGTGTLEISSVMVANGTGIVLGQNAPGTGVINLNSGGVLSVRDITTGAGAGSVSFNGGTLRALENNTGFLNVANAAILGGGLTVDTNGFDVTVVSPLGGAGGLTKSGSGTLALAGASNYGGNTLVSQGILSLANPVLDDDSGVVIGIGAGIHLPHGQIDFIAALTINNEVLGDGDYTSATHPGFITGSGTLRVGDPPEGAYDSWIGGFFPGETDPLIVGPGADPDRDGQPNSMEFMLGGSPLSGSDNARIHRLTADTDADGDASSELVLTIAVPSGSPAFAGTPAPSATKDGYVIRVEGATDPASFGETVLPVAPVTTDLAAPPAGYEYRSFSLGGSNGLPSRGFLRVDVSAAP